jgi:hypothetical protein
MRKGLPAGAGREPSQPGKLKPAESSTYAWLTEESTKVSKIRMTALDIFHATSVRAEPLLADDQFEVSDAEAKELEDRGLAKSAVTKPSRRQRP